MCFLNFDKSIYRIRTFLTYTYFRDIDENLVREVCSEVAEWYTQAAVGDSFTILKNDGRAQ